MSLVIDSRALSFCCGNVTRFHGIDREVSEGEFLGIAGPNAGDKSTLLKLIPWIPGSNH